MLCFGNLSLVQEARHEGWMCLRDGSPRRGLYGTAIHARGQVVPSQRPIRQPRVPIPCRRQASYGIVEHERPFRIAYGSIVRGHDVETPIRRPDAIAETVRRRDRVELVIDR